MFRQLFKFFASLRLAVFTILLLSAVLAVATFVGSYYGMRGSQIVVYDRWWFGGVLFLLGLNVLCAALSRYPWKLRQTGFVITHLGIIVLLVGSWMTQRFGVDGNLPVPEKTQENEVILNQLLFTVLSEKDGQKVEYPVPESHVKEQGSLMKVKLSTNHLLEVDQFIPRAMPKRRYLKSPTENVGVPALQIRLANDRFTVEEWLVSSDPASATELNLGPAVVSFEKLWTADDEKKFFKKVPPTTAPQKRSGTLVVSYQGRDYQLGVDPLINQWANVMDSGLEVRVQRYLPYAVVEKNKLVTKSNEPINPAVEVLVREKGRAESEEKHTVFALFPEFTTLHGLKSRQKPALGVTFRMLAAQDPEELAMVGRSRGRLYLAQSPDNTKLLYRVLSAKGEVNGQGEVPVGKTMSTGWMDLKFEVAEWLPAAVEDQEPRYIANIEGNDQPYLTAIHVTLTSTGPEKEPKQSWWLLEGAGRSLSFGGQEVLLHYHRSKLVLPFQIYLDKFTMGTNPGTTTAASFISDVTVKDPKAEKETAGRISMNEPLVYNGYTFYQASYQMSPGEPPVSVFAVNRDPGRPVKYGGSLLMVLGIFLMFYMNPHYFSILMGKGKT